MPENPIERLGGPDGDDAYHSLIEADEAVIPVLITAFRLEQDPAMRSELVSIIWQHRRPDTIEFLTKALKDPAPDVWKCALDGLVAIGGRSAIRVLESAKQQVESSRQIRSVQAEWIDEALQQAKRAHDGPMGCTKPVRLVRKTAREEPTPG